MRRRGQLVLVAAALVAVALAPLVLAFLQLGYHDDVRATADYGGATGPTVRSLERAVASESAGIPGEYAWAERGAAVTHLRTELAPRVSRLESARVERGTAVRIEYDRPTAAAWASTNCPGGPDRQFGDCVADRGVVVQDRLGRTHVLAVAITVTATTDRGETAVTIVVRPAGPGD
ncbi:DUF7261 family protein [Haloarcula litorea]|uniref:DUF7261 family protein n=1 Tax=Haloarcula litorea TaxID=3032579 RepID=UPI0023E86216|nr:hypothetical protein [Halomicroarcula sp. GDY20]